MANKTHDRTSIESHLRKLLVEDFQIPSDSIDGTTSFRGGLGLDSLDVVDFVMLAQKDLGYKAEVSDYRGVTNMVELVEFVHGRLSR